MSTDRADAAPAQTPEPQPTGPQSTGPQPAEPQEAGQQVPAPRRPAPQAAAPRSWFTVGLRLGLGLLTAYLLVQAVLKIQNVLMLVLLSLVIAVSLEPIVALLTTRGMRRRWAVLIVIVGLVVVLGSLVSLFVPPVTGEVNALVKAIPTWLQQLHDHHSFLGRLEDRYHISTKVKTQLSGGGAGTVVNGLMGAGQLLISTLTGFFLVITLTLYFLAGLPTLKRFCLRFVRGSRRERAEAMTDEVLQRTGRYMLANVATSVIAGLATLIWLQIMGVPYPAALGVFVGLMDLIPVVGSTIGGIVVSLVALVVSFPVAIATAVFYIVFRVAEDYLIVPRAMKFAVEVHPLVTILAVLAGGALMGVIGALIAIPVAVAVGLFLDEAVFPGIAAR
ncbi:AI-2E family transporter [Streptacidiphilus carbonis]|uniref:AI-2E family transporter n=1 Tax=Streptacidiphilus carbonis TaxID=105422 RepID=UPI000B0D3511|nr:AI-2E family transporter [Streptacidiphilus carbonis]